MAQFAHHIHIHPSKLTIFTFIHFQLKFVFFFSAISPIISSFKYPEFTFTPHMDHPKVRYPLILRIHTHPTDITHVFNTKQSSRRSPLPQQLLVCRCKDILNNTRPTPIVRPNDRSLLCEPPLYEHVI
jgi:hypothetical protein